MKGGNAKEIFHKRKTTSVMWTINFNLSILKALICNIFLSYTNDIEIKEHEAI